MRVEDPAEVRPALEQALATEGPALIDVVTDPERPGDAAQGDDPAGQGVRAGDDQDGVHR